MSQQPPGGYYGGTHPLPGGENANGAPHFQGYYDPRYYSQGNPGYPSAPYGAMPYGGQQVYSQGYPVSNPAHHHPPAAPFPVQYATRPPANQTTMRAAEAHPPPPQLGTWFPDAEGYLLIEEWFRELDPEASGLIGGGPVVKFLSRSNLPKETLREIWALVDTNRSGKLSKNQFITVLRFVAVLCSPIYMGSKPTVDLFNSTLKKDISLPSQLKAVPEPPPKAAEPELAAAASTAQSPANLITSSTSSPAAHPAHQLGVHPLAPHQGAPYAHPGYPPQALPSVPGYGYHPYPAHTAAPQLVAPHPSHPPHPGYGLPNPHAHGDASSVYLAAGYDPRAYGYSPQPQLSSTPPPSLPPAAVQSLGSSASTHSLPQPVEGLHLHHTAHALAVGQEEKEEDEEFSDFASAQPSPLPPMSSTPSPVPGSTFSAAGVVTTDGPPAAALGIAAPSLSEDLDDEDAFGPLTSSPLPSKSKSLPSEPLGAGSEDAWDNFTAAPPSINTSPAPSSAPEPLVASDAQTAVSPLSAEAASGPPAASAPVAATQAAISVPQPLRFSSSSSSVPSNSSEKDPLGSSSEIQQAAPVGVPSTLPVQSATILGGHPLGSAPIHTSRDRLSVFDELVEQDMQGLQEDWDDFADSSSSVPAPVISSTAAPTESVHTTTTTTAPVAPAAAAASTAVVHAELMDTPAVQTVTPLNPFDLLDDFPPEPVVSLDLSGGGLSREEHGPPSLPPLSTQTQPRTGEDHNDFGDFSTASTTAPEMPRRTDPPVIQLEPEISAEGDEAEFGAFESHTPTSAPIPSSASPEKPVVSPLPPPCAEEEEEEDEDFGDFSQAASVPSAPASVSLAASSSLPASAMPAVTFVEDDLLLMMDVPPSTSATTAPPPQPSLSAAAASHSLLDLLSDPLPSAVFPASGHGSSQSAFSVPSSREAQPFAAFEDEPFDPFATGPAPAGSHGGEADTPPFSSGREAKAPAASHATSTQLPSSLPPPGAQTHNSSSSSSSSGARDSTRGSTAPLGIAELEGLANALARKRLYEDAYACARQVSILQRLQSLTFQKAQAMENDDLETALQLKKAAVVLAMELQPQHCEAWWQAASRSNRSGDSLHEMEESIALFDEVMSRKFHKLFVATAPAASMGLEASMRHAILAKRSSRMAVITCSSHPNHPKHWQRLLKVLSAKLQQAGAATNKAFVQLSSADQRAVLATSKMSEYLGGLEQLAEAALWVAATSMEAMVYEAESATVWKMAQDVLKVLSTTYQQAPSKYLGISREELSLSAEQATEMPSMATTYCNLSLRPLQSTPKAAVANKQNHSLDDREVMIYYPHQATCNELTFMQPLVNIWLHDVDKVLPPIDSAFC